MAVSIEELSKAAKSLRVSQSLLRDYLTKEPEHIELHRSLRDSCIQRFDFCVELAWKTAIRVLGLSTKAPNPAIRDMAQNKLIDDPQVWFNFLEARNKTSHLYEEEVAQSVYSEIESLLSELDKLINRLLIISGSTSNQN